MKQTKICPKCSGTEIYTDAAKQKNTESRYLPAGKSSWSFISIDAYLCLSCGYLEEFLNEREMKDTQKLEKLKANWKKL